VLDNDSLYDDSLKNYKMYHNLIVVYYISIKCKPHINIIIFMVLQFCPLSKIAAQKIIILILWFGVE